MFALDLVPVTVVPFLSVIWLSRRFNGRSVNYPYKQDVYAKMDFVSARAVRLGGDATDGTILTNARELQGESIRGSAAPILGTGGGADHAISDAFAKGTSPNCIWWISINKNYTRQWVSKPSIDPKALSCGFCRSRYGSGQIAPLTGILAFG